MVYLVLPRRVQSTPLSGSSTQHMLLVLFLPNGYAKLMRPNRAEAAVHGCHCPGDMAVRMRKVLARPWVGVESLAFIKQLLDEVEHDIVN